MSPRRGIEAATLTGACLVLLRVFAGRLPKKRTLYSCSSTPPTDVPAPPPAPGPASPRLAVVLADFVSSIAGSCMGMSCVLYRIPRRYEGGFLKGEIHGRGHYMWSDGGHYEVGGGGGKSRP